MHILLVEDDLPLAQSLSKALANSSYVVNHVATGTHALSAVQADRPDILILDLGLPDMDGMTLLRQLRHKHPELPVLLLTARDSVEDRVSGLDSGVGVGDSSQPPC